MRKITLIILCMLSFNIVKAADVDWDLLTGNAGYGARAFFSGVTKSAKLYVMAGQRMNATIVNDVWGSSNGSDWTALTKNAGFSPRSNQHSIIFGDNILVIGGNNGTTYYNDVWSSSDGIDWEALTENAEFGIGEYVKGAVVFNGVIFITKNKAVWSSSDGIDWAALTENAEFDTAAGHNLVVYDNKIYMIGGYGYGNTWYSEDGVEWTSLTKNAGFGTSPILKSVVYNNKIYTYNYFNKKIYSTEDGIVFTELTTTGMHDLYSPNGFLTLINNKIVLCDSYYSGIDNKSVWIMNFLPPTPTASPSNTPKPSITETWTCSPTITMTPSVTNTTTKTVTLTITETVTPLPTLTITKTTTPTFTITMTSTYNSPTATSTITETWTLTPTDTTVPDWTATPVPTMYLKFLHYQECTNCGNCGFALEWNYIPVTLESSNNFFRLYYNGDYSYWEDVKISKNETVSTSRFVYTLKDLQWDKVYDITVAAFFPDVEYSNTSNAIYISCFETPTPFAGTATATNSPDCNPPTATPTPQVTIVQTVVGKYIFDDFSSYPFGTTVTADNSDWDVVSANAIAQATAVGTPGYNWVTTIQDGYTAVKAPYQCTYEWHQGLGMWLNLKDEDEVYYQARVRKGITNAQLIAGSTAVTETANPTLWVWDYIHNYQVWGHVFYGFVANNPKNQNQLWTDVYTYQSVTKGSEHLLVDVATNSRIMHADTMYNNLGDYFGTGVMLWKVSVDSRGTQNMWLTNILIAKNKWVTIHGVEIGDKVQLLNSSDVVTDTLVADTTYVKFNMVGTMTPTQRKVRVINTNGWVYTSTLLTVCAGDQWTYNLVP